jgi:NhaP-type Na+/H+ or K+/H+ antiporter
VIYQNLTLIAAFLLLYSLFAGRFESRLINGPLMFLLTGLLLGPAVLNMLQISVTGPVIRVLAELTLAIVLFTDAALGKAVVTNPGVPAPVREALNVESGLNDGICVPLQLTWRTWVYAIASLTILRMIPVWISLIGSGLTTETKLFTRPW